MLTCWLIFTAFLSDSVSNGATIAVAPICQVEAQCKAELTLQCGDGNTAGLVQYWHTPFGDLHPGLHSELDPVYMQHKGNLVLSNVSRVHSGLYYCLLQHTDGMTLWPHELRVASSRCNQPISYGAARSRRDVGTSRLDLPTARQGRVSDGHFTGAVVGSVLLTFVVGFSAGALCRNQVLRCLGALIARWRSPESDVPDHASEVSMTTMSPVFNNHVVEIEHGETITSSTASVPPAKPQRSFREKRQDEREMTDNLKGCEGQAEEEEEQEEEEEEEKRGRSSAKMSSQEFDVETKEKDGEEDGERGRRLAEKNHVCKGEIEDKEGRGLNKRKQWRDEEREEQEDGGGLEGLTKGCEKETRFYPVDGFDETRTNEETEEQVKKEGKEKKEAFPETEEENSDQEDRSKEERATDGIMEEEERRREYDGEEDSEEEESPVTEQPACPPAPRPGRPSRVIRLYQYDDEGQRYSHVPQPRPDEPGPAPRLQQRSISLTRLSAIMAAASAGPLEPGDTERGERSRERDLRDLEI